MKIMKMLSDVHRLCLLVFTTSTLFTPKIFPSLLLPCSAHKLTTKKAVAASHYGTSIARSRSISGGSSPGSSIQLPRAAVTPSLSKSAVISPSAPTAPSPCQLLAKSCQKCVMKKCTDNAACCIGSLTTMIAKTAGLKALDLYTYDGGRGEFYSSAGATSTASGLFGGGGSSSTPFLVTQRKQTVLQTIEEKSRLLETELCRYENAFRNLFNSKKVYGQFAGQKADMVAKLFGFEEVNYSAVKWPIEKKTTTSDARTTASMENNPNHNPFLKFIPDWSYPLEEESRGVFIALLRAMSTNNYIMEDVLPSETVWQERAMIDEEEAVSSPRVSQEVLDNKVKDARAEQEFLRGQRLQTDLEEIFADTNFVPLSKRRSASTPTFAPTATNNSNGGGSSAGANALSAPKTTTTGEISDAAVLAGAAPPRQPSLRKSTSRVAMTKLRDLDLQVDDGTKLHLSSTITNQENAADVFLQHKKISIAPLPLPSSPRPSEYAGDEPLLFQFHLPAALPQILFGFEEAALGIVKRRRKYNSSERDSTTSSADTNCREEVDDASTTGCTPYACSPHYDFEREGSNALPVQPRGIVNSGMVYHTRENTVLRLPSTTAQLQHQPPEIVKRPRRSFWSRCCGKRGLTKNAGGARMMAPYQQDHYDGGLSDIESGLLEKEKEEDKVLDNEYAAASMQNCDTMSTVSTRTPSSSADSSYNCGQSAARSMAMPANQEVYDQAKMLTSASQYNAGRGRTRTAKPASSSSRLAALSKSTECWRKLFFLNQCAGRGSSGSSKKRRNNQQPLGNFLPSSDRGQPMYPRGHQTSCSSPDEDDFDFACYEDQYYCNNFSSEDDEDHSDHCSNEDGTDTEGGCSYNQISEENLIAYRTTQELLLISLLQALKPLTKRFGFMLRAVEKWVEFEDTEIFDEKQLHYERIFHQSDAIRMLLQEIVGGEKIPKKPFSSTYGPGGGGVMFTADELRGEKSKTPVGGGSLRKAVAL
ncbi:unnamed protein product [Amoebophrya sp. A120]|nr:unnamed protein product [Amoebophrya sp. A120]|eukprot:GSA120T00014061001.1